MPPYTLRAAGAEDAPALWQMLYYAANMAADGSASPSDAYEHPYLARYVRGWGAAGDVGVLAEAGGQAIGAAWARVLEAAPGAEPSDPGAPELAIAVLPAWHGQGVGAALLEALKRAARPRYPALSLTVREGNPAVRLYLRHGFTVTETIVNRVGGRSLAMRAELR